MDREKLMKSIKEYLANLSTEENKFDVESSLKEMKEKNIINNMIMKKHYLCLRKSSIFI